MWKSYYANNLINILKNSKNVYTIDIEGKLMIGALDNFFSHGIEFYLYGAGKRGRDLLALIDKCGYKSLVKGFIVKNVNENDSEIGGIPV